MSKSFTSDSQNLDPNRGLDLKQSNVWAEELRRADERALKYKSDLHDYHLLTKDLESRLKDL